MNQDYVIYNAQGEILRTGSCPEYDLELQAQEGEFLLVGKACCIKDSVNVETREVIECGRPIMAAPAPTPSAVTPTMTVDLQLDLLWQAMDAGTYPKAEPFYSAIKAAKEAK